MDNAELEMIKEEMAALGVRLDNVEGYFGNFDTTLNNHMADYSLKQAIVAEEVAHLRSMFNLAFWTVFSLMTLTIGGLLAGAIALLVEFLKKPPT